MATISVSLPSDGTTADVADYNTPITTVVNAINGGLDNDNIKAAAAIDGSKLADGTVTAEKVAAGMVVQTVSTASSAVATGTTIIPLDDTIPQNTEGNEFMTLAITPKSATNILVIETVLLLSNSAANVELIAAIFQDTTSNALAAGVQFMTTATGVVTVTVKHSMVAGTTSATTFKVRAGGHVAGTTTLNGQAGARLLNTSTKSSIVITEYKA